MGSVPAASHDPSHQSGAIAPSCIVGAVVPGTHLTRAVLPEGISWGGSWSNWGFHEDINEICLGIYWIDTCIQVCVHIYIYIYIYISYNYLCMCLGIWWGIYNGISLGHKWGFHVLSAWRFKSRYPPLCHATWLGTPRTKWRLLAGKIVRVRDGW